jgi:malonate transporter
VLEVLEGFTLIVIVVATGAILGHHGVLGESAASVLSRLTVHVAVPALLFVTLSKASTNEIFSLPLLVTAVTTFTIFGSY